MWPSSSQYQRGGFRSRSLRRGVSRKLRELYSRESIDSTHSLVQACNQATDALQVHALRDWLQHYVDWFLDWPIERAEEEDVQEYVLLGQLRVRCMADKRLLFSWFCSLCNAVRDAKYGVNKIVAALELALLMVDKSIFEENPTLLLDLSKDLLSLLDPTRTVFKKATYGTHCATLSALHQTFVMAQEISPQLLDPKTKGGVYQVFKTRLQEVAACQSYYPILFQVMLVKQSIQRLEQGQNIPTLTGVLSRLYRGTVGALCVVEGLRGLAVAEFKHDAFEAGYNNLQEAFQSLRIDQKPWYEWIQALSRATLAAAKDPEHSAEFETCFDELMQKQSGLKKEDRRAVRFGMIRQLQTLILHALDENVRSKGVLKLLDLAKKKRCGGWADKETALEALLDAMGAVYDVVENKQALESAVESMASFQKAGPRKILSDWLGTSSVRDKLQSFHRTEEIVPPGRLFGSIKDTIRSCEDMDDVNDNHEELKALYQSDNFATVKSLFDGEEPAHVESFQFDLVRYEEVDKEKDDHKQQGHSVENHERKNMTRKPIELRELFARRSIKLNGPVQEINKVLLVGNPGTGKTSISKKLATLWASGEWGVEFDAVYVLQVRDVSDKFYDEGNMRRAQTLATAIANNRFRRKNNEQFEALHELIDKQLQKKTTLLILDGLDESAGACDVILQEAKHCPCKLLMLSRPYGLHQERRLADIEVECLGLSDAQLTDFVKAKLPQQGPEKLLSFLKANRSVWDVAHVPVTTNILCFLWTEGSEELLKEGSGGSLLMLYSKMAHYVWDRYVRKYKICDTDREEVFGVLGRIAFEALTDGQILISQSLVKEHAANSSLEMMLKTSGFLLLQLEGILYQFPHLTWEEYFAGKQLATDLFQGSDQARSNAREFIAENKYCPKYRVMLSFAAEEIRRKQGIAAFDVLMSVVDLAPIDITGVQHMWLKLSLLESFLSIPLKGNELDRLQHTSAPSIATAVARALPPCLRSGWKMKSVAIDALQAAPKTINIFSQIASVIVERYHGLPSTREAAEETIQIVRLVPSRSDDIVDRLLAMCGDPDEDVGWEGAEALSQVAGIVRNRSNAITNRLLAMCIDPDGNVRARAAPALSQVVGLVPNQTDDIVDELLVICGDPDKRVRMEAANALPKVARLVPNRSDDIVDVLLVMCGDPDEHVQSLAALELPQVAELVPGRTDDIVDRLLAMCRDPDGFVRGCVAVPLSQVMGLVPGRLDDIVDRLLAMCRDPDLEVRRETALALSQVMGLVPSRADDIVDRFLAMRSDPDAQVQWWAAETIPQVIGLVPDRIGDIVDRLLAMSIDPAGNVRQGAALALSQVAGLVPRRADDIVDRLLTMCRDPDSHVQGRAALALSQVVRLVPGRSDDIVDGLLTMCGDPDGEVQRLAALALPVVVGLVPGRTDDIIDGLLAMCKDPDEQVQCQAAETISQVVRLVPGLADEIVDRLLTMCRDSNEWVSYYGVLTLTLIPLDKLISYRGLFGDQLPLRSIASQFLQFAVVTKEHVAPESIKLCLMTSASRSIESVKPRREFQKFISKVKNEIDDEFPGLLLATGSITPASNF